MGGPKPQRMLIVDRGRVAGPELGLGGPRLGLSGTKERVERILLLVDAGEWWIGGPRLFGLR